MSGSDNTIVAGVSRVLQDRLPPGWATEKVARSGSAPLVRITSQEGRSAEFVVVVFSHPYPRSASLLPRERPLLVAAPYLSRAVRDVIEGEGASYADETGNVRIVLGEPGLFITTSGADSNPWPRARQFTLRGAKAGRVVCSLVQSAAPIGVRELAGMADTDPGYVSRLLGMLDSEAIVDRDPRGAVLQVHWRKLLTRWSEEAPLENRAKSSTWLAPRGMRSLWDGLRKVDFPYLITGSAAAYEIAPVAPARLASIYVEDPEEVARKLGLVNAPAGANVQLLEPEERTIFDRADTRNSLRYAPLPLIVADLLSGPGRSPAEAEALMEWMDINAEAWRG